MATLNNLFRKLLNVNTAVFRNMRIETSPDGVVTVRLRAYATSDSLWNPYSFPLFSMHKRLRNLRIFLNTGFWDCKTKSR